MHDMIEKIYQQNNLSQDESFALFDKIIQNELDPILTTSILSSLKTKTEHYNEIAGAAQAIRKNAKPFDKPDYDFADIVGTGGDNSNTINVSTTAALVGAACGVKVAKHGSRSVSSLSGASDLLNALGIDINADVNTLRTMLDQHNFCFLFAPNFHPAFVHVAPIRQAMKTRTIFNILGPLVNPAQPPLQILGVYTPDLLLPMANALRQIGVKHAFIVHGSGLDEVALHGDTMVAELYNNEINQYTLSPADFGVKKSDLDDIKGGTPEHNCQITKDILSGQGTTAQMNVVAINTALLLKLFGFPDLQDNTQRALSAMANKQGTELLKSLTTN